MSILQRQQYCNVDTRSPLLFHLFCFRQNCTAEFRCYLWAFYPGMSDYPFKLVTWKVFVANPLPNEFVERTIFVCERDHLWQCGPMISPKLLNFILSAFCNRSVVTVPVSLEKLIDVLPRMKLICSFFGGFGIGAIKRLGNLGFRQQREDEPEYVFHLDSKVYPSSPSLHQAASGGLSAASSTRSLTASGRVESAAPPATANAYSRPRLCENTKSISQI
jgi:hypothetical protein